MSEVKHTPGPWNARGNTVWAVGKTDTYEGPVSGCIAAARSTHTMDSDNRTWSCAGDPDDNARLIAAAPELLEALEYVLDHPLVHLDSTCEVRILAAIAKAKGDA